MTNAFSRFAIDKSSELIKMSIQKSIQKSIGRTIGNDIFKSEIIDALILMASGTIIENLPIQQDGIADNIKSECAIAGLEKSMKFISDNLQSVTKNFGPHLTKMLGDDVVKLRVIAEDLCIPIDEIDEKEKAKAK